MKFIGRLKSKSALLSREYPDQRTGGTRKVQWMELHLSDGIDDFVGEMTVRPTQQQDGTMTAVEPQLQTDALYTVELQMATNVTKAGTPEARRFNKLLITKIVAL